MNVIRSRFAREILLYNDDKRIENQSINSCCQFHQQFYVIITAFLDKRLALNPLALENWQNKAVLKTMVKLTPGVNPIEEI
jgi:hypothetical protein